MTRRTSLVFLFAFSLAFLASCAANPSTGTDGGGGGMDGSADAGSGECVRDEDCPDDGIFCNGGLACSAGRCVADAVPTCNDGVGCTIDTCLAATDECQNTPVDGMCPSGTVCYTGRGCAAAQPCEFDSDCTGDGVFCNGVEVCVDTLCASPADGLGCDDENSCTQDECVESMGDCVNTPFADMLTNPMHCGTGANDCVTCPDGPAGGHQVGTCAAGACGLECETGWSDRDGDPANGCEYNCTLMPGVDSPDDAFTDGDCDGIDGDRTRAIFLSTAGADTNDGLTPGTPVASFTRAFEVYFSNLSRNQILVANGSYSTSTMLSLPNGVGLYGGYSNDFLTRTDSRASLTASSRTAIRANGLRSPTVIDRINITTGDRTTASESTTAMIVNDSLDRLTLRFMTVTAGHGGAGTNGSPGSMGTIGGTGGNGSGPSGGGGAAPGGGGSSGRGGAGATGLTQAAGPAGAPGNGGSCGAGGPAGAGSGGAGLGCSDGDPADGHAPTSPGCTGIAGAGGAAGDGMGTLTGETWSPSNGAIGSQGGVGGGGGGGGAGGGEDCTAPIVGCVYCGTGRGGGGGGGGGQGGSGGGGGTGGGASIGLLLISSTVVAHQLRIQTAGGGNGGSGAVGGPGGNGGPGGSGATRTSNTQGNGGAGGPGGGGGSGGCGGGGGGGPSVAVWGNGTSARVRESTPVSYAPGAGGGGGTSCGSSGAAGISSNLRDAFPE
jgi:hypothetical protein